MSNVLDFINTLKIDKNDYIIVACSGGPDSMYLMNFLNELGYKIVCVHVNHKLRKESDDEYKFVKNYCENNNIIFEGNEIEDFPNENIENYARKFRYNFFENIINKYNSKYLFTAHHGDDLIETILMRISRGSSMKGYSAFNKITKRNSYYVVRPLIYLTKREIEKKIKEKGIPYVLDNSNFEDDYTRNRFRHHVLPFLYEEDSKVNEKFLYFSEELNRSYKYLKELTIKNYKEIVRDNILNIDKFNKLDEFMKEELIKYVFEILYPDNLYLISSGNVIEVLKIINSTKPNLKLNLPGGISVVKKYNDLIFNNQYESNDSYSYELNEILELEMGTITVVDESKDTSNYTIRLKSSDVKLPIIVRCRKDGDKIKVKNMSGTKKVNDVFIDNKIIKEDRDMWPIVCDSDDKILWLPGLKKSNFDIPINEDYDIIITYAKKERK